MMNINFYRRPNGEGAENSWSNCQFSSDTDLTGLAVKPLVTINRPLSRSDNAPSMYCKPQACKNALVFCLN